MISTLQMPKSNTQTECRYPCVHSFKGVKSHSSAGFTLIEILVTISIIALLLGIGAVGMSQVQKAARAAQVKSMLEGLEGALTEYQTQTKTYPPEDDGTHNADSESFVYAVSQVPTAYDALLAAVSSGSSKANKRIFNDGQGGNDVNEIYDVWEEEILYRASNIGGAYPNLPASKHPFFISSGPDKTFGTDDDISTLELD